MDIALFEHGGLPPEALVFFRYEGTGNLLPDPRSWLEGRGAWLAAQPGLRSFSGRARSVRYFYPPADQPGPVVIVAGLGKPEKAGPPELRQAMAAVVECTMELELVSLGMDAGVFRAMGLDACQAMEDAVCAATGAAYRFDQLKTEQEQPIPPVPTLYLFPGDEDRETLRKGLDKGLALSRGVRLARDLVNMPSNLATPAYLADKARHLASAYGFGLDILEARQIESLGMGAFAAVFQANPEQARLIILDSCPDSAGHDGSASKTDQAGTDQTDTAPDRECPLVFIGKGITFDTGGISLKPSQNMEEMKDDMAGAASVLGFFEALGRMGSTRRVVGIMPCTENLPGARAIKPGEVVRTFSGKSVEIINTDAEGRLVLCDVLAYSQRYAPRGIVDLATLTGAMVVSLGPRIAGAFSSGDDLNRLVQNIGQRVGEPIWPMPLWDDYMEELKSEVADLKNAGSREGGAIHAALFLRRFVPKNTPWIHLDIAGPAFSKKKRDLGAAGGTGFGVRTLVELLEDWPGSK